MTDRPKQSDSLEVVSKGVIVANFGGPRCSDDLTPFLTRLLSDVLPGPNWLSRRLAPIVARHRARRVVDSYQRIGWSPLVQINAQQVEALRQSFGSDGPPIATAMMYTPPEFDAALRALATSGVAEILAIPMFPHYSIATTQSAFNLIYDAQKAAGLAHIPIRYVTSYCTHPTYVEALASTIEQGVAQTRGQGPIHLLFSAHGLPVSYVTRHLDPYAEQIESTVKAVIDALAWKEPYHLSWQSRLGPVAWLRPSTEEMLERLSGANRVTIVPLSFVCDHLETLDEIDIGLAERATKLGISHFARAPALNLNPTFIKCLKEITVEGLTDPPTAKCPRCQAPIRSRRCPACGFRKPKYLGAT